MQARCAPCEIYCRDVIDTTHPASPPDPPQDQPGNPMPEYIAAVLHAVSILLGYGRHLLATVHHRATAPTFPTIAACFGTANLSTILAHLNRGILRATALERFLLARAATGRDINIVTRRTRTDETPPAPADPQAEQPADQPARPKATPRPSLPPGCGRSRTLHAHTGGTRSSGTPPRRRPHHRRDLRRSRRRPRLLHPRLLERAVRGHALLRRQTSPP